MTYAVYANRKLVLSTSDRDEAELRYDRCKLDPKCKHVAIGKVLEKKAPARNLEDMMKPKPKTTPNPALNYTQTVDAAIAKLRLAVNYAEDGAHIDAASCAVDATGLLFKAARMRNEFLFEATNRFKGVKS